MPEIFNFFHPNDLLLRVFYPDIHVLVLHRAYIIHEHQVYHVPNITLIRLVMGLGLLDVGHVEM